MEIAIEIADLDTQLCSLLKLDQICSSETERESQWDCEKSKEHFLEDDAVIIAKHDDQVVGFCRVRINADVSVGLIYVIFVRPQYRRQGVGSSLIVTAFDYMRNRNCCQAFLGVSAENDGAFNLYRKLGFQATRISMAKDL